MPIGSAEVAPGAARGTFATRRSRAARSPSQASPRLPARRASKTLESNDMRSPNSMYKPPSS
eukprot:11363864-Heterocapsa_arctica.AAC.1